jgi:MurNAc alpha-1-phosphate uridylyltransferase
MVKIDSKINLKDPIQIVILAGGLGTRLRPLTEQIPKAMIPILGKPFMDFQLRLLSRCGIQEVILSTGYLGEMIKEFVRDGRDWNLKVTYVNEGKNLRGTGGALRLIYDHGLLREHFLVTYGDSYLPISYRDIWQEFSKRTEPALMTVLRNGEKWDASNSCFDGENVTLYDKKIQPKPKEMQFIDYGLSAFSKALIGQEIPKDQKFDLATLLNQLSINKQLAGLEVKERFYEVGSLQGIQDLEAYLQ